MKVESLRPYQKKVNVTVKAMKKNEPREVTSKLDDSKHNVTEALVGDDSATILMTLWDDDIAKVEAGKTYDIVNGFTSLFKNSLRLNIGRYGELKDGSVEIAEINEENNISGSEGDEEAPAAKAPAPAAEAAGEAKEEADAPAAEEAKEEPAAEPAAEEPIEETETLAVEEALGEAPVEEEEPEEAPAAKEPIEEPAPRPAKKKKGSE